MSSSTTSADIVQIQKMVFIFNAILDGWTVKMIEENIFEFKKDRDNREVDLNDYLRKFVLHNLSLNINGTDESLQSSHDSKED
jgi:hypothetical protein